MDTFKYRLLWTWDGWICRRDAASFLRNYKKLVDTMAERGLNGLIVWGLLDDAHGGADAAVELCEYANRNGVRILAGVGIFSYGGIYCRGHHLHNLETRVARHPEAGAVFARDYRYATPFDVPLPRHVPRGILCPSRPENLAWTEKGVEWLCRNVPIGGVNFETGDNGLCACPACAARRHEKTEAYSFADMGNLLPHFSKLVHSLAPELWITSGIYTDYWTPPLSELRRLRPMPRYAVTQWNVAALGQEYAPTRKIETLFSHQNVGYARYNGSTHFPELYSPIYPYYSCWGFSPFVDSAARFCRTARDEGLDGVCFTGSGLAASPDNAINYRAFSCFARNPSACVETFGQEELGPLFGAAAAPRVLEGLRQLETVNHQLRLYLMWILPLFGKPTGDWGDKAWGILEKVDPRAPRIESDWRRCARTICKGLALLRQAERQAHAAGRRRLSRIAKILAQELFLFERLFPACRPVCREYGALTQHGLGTATERRRHYSRAQALARLVESSPLDTKLFSPSRMLVKYRRVLGLATV
ncbi:MAG: hypothetical protein PHR35_13635 [Kiritimatiellae bacterium]|nr:hypothetical protein [Kiritimatiellia bacterium]